MSHHLIPIPWLKQTISWINLSGNDDQKKILNNLLLEVPYVNFTVNWSWSENKIIFTLQKDILPGEHTINDYIKYVISNLDYRIEFNNDQWKRLIDIINILK
jgi:hypothetical protein